jgi:hypothetical protein
MASDNPFANLGLGMMGSESSYARQGMSASDGSTGAILLNALFGTDLPTTQKGLKEYKSGMVTGVPPAGAAPAGAAPVGAVAPAAPVEQSQAVAPIPPITPSPTQPLQQQDQTTAPTVGVFRKFLDFMPKQ